MTLKQDQPRSDDAGRDRREAFLAKTGRERALGALVVANRLIAERIAQQGGGGPSETVENRQ